MGTRTQSKPKATSKQAKQAKQAEQAKQDKISKAGKASKTLQRGKPRSKQHLKSQTILN